MENHGVVSRRIITSLEEDKGCVSILISNRLSIKFIDYPCTLQANGSGNEETIEFISIDDIVTSSTKVLAVVSI